LLRREASWSGEVEPDFDTSTPSMKKTAPIQFAGSRLAESRHVCAFFNDDDEAYRVLLPFITDGFRCNHKAVHVVNPGQDIAHRRRLTAAGIDLAGAERSGQFDLRINTDTYLRDGTFDPDRMLDVFEHLASGNQQSAFPLSRVVCHMDWARDGSPYVERLIEFESRVNDIWMRHEDAVICTYNLARVNGATVVDIMRTHPMVIVGGVLQQNPFYVPPEQFLLELRERQTQSRSN
jgi:hypothetical protein